MYIQQNKIQPLTGPGLARIGGLVSEQALENTVGIALLGDLNEQLGKIAFEMKSQLEAKQELRGTLTFVKELQTRPNAGGPMGTDIIEISPEEKQKLEASFPKMRFVSNSKGTAYFVSKPDLKNAEDQAQDQISQMNATSELTAIQVQSLSDQRKNALAMLSNLMAAKNESLMAIIRNLKS